jgi:hypothetical protein
MSNGGPLINIGDLTKPATLLIEKITEGIAGIYRPYQIRRIAEAEAEAEKIHAIAHIEIDELQRRALTRFVAEETNKQSNIEEIVKKAIPELAGNSRPDNIENDWIANFFDKCKLISDEEMQALWSKVLAGEANSPGRYSKRTINFLATMDKSDANIFSILCRYIWDIGGDVVPLVFNLHDKIYDKEGLTFDVIKHLQDIGIIMFSIHTTYNKQLLPKIINVSYQGLRFRMELPKQENNQMEVGKVLLSRVGSELVPLVGKNPISGFVEYVIAQFLTDGCIISSDWPRVMIKE